MSSISNNPPPIIPRSNNSEKDHSDKKITPATNSWMSAIKRMDETRKTPGQRIRPTLGKVALNPSNFPTSIPRTTEPGDEIYEGNNETEVRVTQEKDPSESVTSSFSSERNGLDLVVLPNLPELPPSPPTKDPRQVVENRGNNNKKKLQHRDGKTDLEAPQKKENLAALQKMTCKLTVQRIEKSLQKEVDEVFIARRVLNLLFCAAGGRNVIDNPNCPETAIDTKFLSERLEDQRPMYIDALSHLVPWALPHPLQRYAVDKINTYQTTREIEPLLNWLGAQLGHRKLSQ